MIKPFADDESAASIGNLSIENGTIAVVLSGSLEITLSADGLMRARALKQLADELVIQLEHTPNLPEQTAPSLPDTRPVVNPFA